MYCWGLGSISLSLDSEPASHLGIKKIQDITEGRMKKGPRELETVAPRPELGAPGVPLTTEALAACGNSPEHLCRRVAVSLTPLVCPASSSTIVGEHDDMNMHKHEYMLHRDYH